MTMPSWGKTGLRGVNIKPTSWIEKLRNTKIEIDPFADWNTGGLSNLWSSLKRPGYVESMRQLSQQYGATDISPEVQKVKGWWTPEWQEAMANIATGKKNALSTELLGMYEGRGGLPDKNLEWFQNLTSEQLGTEIEKEKVRARDWESQKIYETTYGASGANRGYVPANIISLFARAQQVGIDETILKTLMARVNDPVRTATGAILPNWANTAVKLGNMIDMQSRKRDLEVGTAISETFPDLLKKYQMSGIAPTGGSNSGDESDITIREFSRWAVTQPEFKEREETNKISYPELASRYLELGDTKYPFSVWLTTDSDAQAYIKAKDEATETKRLEGMFPKRTNVPRWMTMRG